MERARLGRQSCRKERQCRFRERTLACVPSQWVVWSAQLLRWWQVLGTMRHGRWLAKRSRLLRPRARARRTVHLRVTSASGRALVGLPGLFRTDVWPFSGRQYRKNHALAGARSANLGTSRGSRAPLPPRRTSSALAAASSPRPRPSWRSSLSRRAIASRPATSRRSTGRRRARIGTRARSSRSARTARSTSCTTMRTTR